MLRALCEAWVALVRIADAPVFVSFRNPQKSPGPTRFSPASSLYKYAPFIPTTHMTVYISFVWVYIPDSVPGLALASASMPRQIPQRQLS
jgi:hypothetical protein